MGTTRRLSSSGATPSRGCRCLQKRRRRRLRACRSQRIRRGGGRHWLRRNREGDRQGRYCQARANGIHKEGVHGIPQDLHEEVVKHMKENGKGDDVADFKSNIQGAIKAITAEWNEYCCYVNEDFDCEGSTVLCRYEGADGATPHFYYLMAGFTETKY